MVELDLLEEKCGNILRFPREGGLLDLSADKSGHLTLSIIKLKGEHAITNSYHHYMFEHALPS